MYEAFVLICLVGKPMADEFCNQLQDIRGIHDPRSVFNTSL